MIRFASMTFTDSPDTLDLHTFRPSDVNEVIPAFLEECQALNIQRARIIHGKGTGTLRERTRSILSTHPAVLRFYNAPDASGWGATLVELVP